MTAAIAARFAAPTIEGVAARFFPQFFPKAAKTAVGVVGLGVGIHHATEGNSPTIHYGERKLEVIHAVRPDTSGLQSSSQPKRTGKLLFQSEGQAMSSLPRDHILFSESKEGGESNKPSEGGPGGSSGGGKDPNDPNDPKRLGKYFGAVVGAYWAGGKYEQFTPYKDRQIMGYVGSMALGGVVGGVVGANALTASAAVLLTHLVDRNAIKNLRGQDYLDPQN